MHFRKVLQKTGKKSEITVISHFHSGKQNPASVYKVYEVYKAEKDLIIEIRCHQLRCDLENPEVALVPRNQEMEFLPIRTTTSYLPNVQEHEQRMLRMSNY